MTKPTPNVQPLIDQMKKHIDAIAKERDALRALEKQAREVCDCSDRAVSALEEAVDALSEYL